MFYTLLEYLIVAKKLGIGMDEMRVQAAREEAEREVKAAAKIANRSAAGTVLYKISPIRQCVCVCVCLSLSWICNDSIKNSTF